MIPTKRRATSRMMPYSKARAQHQTLVDSAYLCFAMNARSAHCDTTLSLAFLARLNATSA